MCVCLCACVRVCVCVCVCMCLHSCVRVCVCVCLCVCLCVCVCREREKDMERVYVCVRAYARVCICMCMCERESVCRWNLTYPTIYLDYAANLRQMYAHTYMYTSRHILMIQNPRVTPPIEHKSAQGWKNRTLIGHERVDSRFLVLAGNESIFTEITEYIYFSLILTRVEFKYKSD